MRGDAEVDLETEVKDSSQGGCQDKTETRTFKGKWPGMSSHPLHVQGSIAPKGSYVGGSRRFPLAPPGSADPSVTANEHSIRVNWHLHRYD